MKNTNRTKQTQIHRLLETHRERTRGRTTYLGTLSDLLERTVAFLSVLALLSQDNLDHPARALQEVEHTRPHEGGLHVMVNL